MALKKFYIGSTGPFYYDDEEVYPEDVNENSERQRYQVAFRAEDVYLGNPDDVEENLDSVAEHIDDTTIHFEEGDIDHNNIQNVGSSTHAQIDSHIADSDIHLSTVQAQQIRDVKFREWYNR